MKQLYIFTFITFIYWQGLKSQIYYQYFDGANTSTVNSVFVNIDNSLPNNIWQVGKPQKTLFSSASTTPNVIVTDTINYVPNNNVSRFSFLAKSIQSFQSIIAIRWKQKLDMDQGKDGGIVEYSTNSGTTWNNVFNNPGNIYSFYGFNPPSQDTLPSGEFCFSGTDNTWRDIWLCLSGNVSVLNDTVLLRFTFKSDSVNTNKEGWMIDNLQVYNTIFHPVKQVSQDEPISIYPNISHGIVNIEMKKEKETDVIESMDLISADGKVVQHYGQNSKKTVIDISSHPPGLYHLRVNARGKSVTHSIILEKQ